MKQLLLSQFSIWRVLFLLVPTFYFSSEKVSAECGDYVVILNAPQDKSHHDGMTTPVDQQFYRHGAHDPVKAPCNGPNCSGKPDRKFPPIAPVTTMTVRLKELTQPLIISTHDDQSSFLLVCNPFSTDPIDGISAIFHPPRPF